MTENPEYYPEYWYVELKALRSVVKLIDRYQDAAAIQHILDGYLICDDLREPRLGQLGCDNDSSVYAACVAGVYIDATNMIESGKSLDYIKSATEAEIKYLQNRYGAETEP